jgi:hypothetical protein
MDIHAVPALTSRHPRDMRPVTGWLITRDGTSPRSVSSERGGKSRDMPVAPSVLLSQAKNVCMLLRGTCILSAKVEYGLTHLDYFCSFSPALQPVLTARRPTPGRAWHTAGCRSRVQNSALGSEPTATPD